MSIQQIVEHVGAFEGVLVLAPDADGGFPELAWGDFFFYYAPDGEVPPKVQPYATIVTKDYPDDTRSELDPEGRWRVNVHVGAVVFEELTGGSPRDFGARHTGSRDFAEADVFLPHPVYGALGWVAVVNPADRTMPKVLELLSTAHADTRRRADRRAQLGQQRADQNGGGSSPASGGE
jgi:hypothetical protein